MTAAPDAVFSHITWRSEAASCQREATVHVRLWAAIAAGSLPAECFGRDAASCQAHLPLGSALQHGAASVGKRCGALRAVRAAA